MRESIVKTRAAPMPDSDHNPETLADNSSAPVALLVLERALRAHPIAVGILTISAMALIAAAELVTTSDFALSLTIDVMYALPLAVCTYGLGVTAGLLGALGVSLVGVIDSLQEGLAHRDILLVFVVRLLSHLGIVAMTGLAAASARARERYLEAQQELVRMRADLVSAFSHDLRTPLATIVGYAELLRDDSDDLKSEDARAALDCILMQGRLLDKLIGDMLSAGRSEAMSPLQVSSFSPEALVAELRGELDQAPRATSVALPWEVAPATATTAAPRARPRRSRSAADRRGRGVCADSGDAARALSLPYLPVSIDHQGQPAGLLLPSLVAVKQGLGVGQRSPDTWHPTPRSVDSPAGL